MASRTTKYEEAVTPVLIDGRAARDHFRKMLEQEMTHIGAELSRVAERGSSSGWLIERYETCRSWQEQVGRSESQYAVRRTQAAV